MEAQKLYQEAIKFATAKHLEREQKIPGTDLPYVVHLSNVAMEIIIASFNSDNFNLDFAVQVALLHDTIEDTTTDFEELASKFGVRIAEAVSALTKNKELPKEQQMRDSLTRIKTMQTEVWAIKLADRITNLQSPPPNWDNEKRIKYQKEARMILSELKEGNDFLAKRLETKIVEYGTYLNTDLEGRNTPTNRPNYLKILNSRERTEDLGKTFIISSNKISSNKPTPPTPTSKNTNGMKREDFWKKIDREVIYIYDDFNEIYLRSQPMRGFYAHRDGMEEYPIGQTTNIVTIATMGNEINVISKEKYYSTIKK
ncbi:MAG: HD domain-containing protein [Ferruginibacter sp.]